MSTYRNAPEDSGAHRLAGRPGGGRPWWLLALLALLAVVLVLFLFRACDDDEVTTEGTRPVAAPAATASLSATASPAASTPAPGSTPTNTPTASPPTAPTSAAPTPTNTSPNTPAPTSTAGTAGNAGPLRLADIASADLSQYVGLQVSADNVRVLNVPADEGFWIGTSEGSRFWVQLIGQPGESEQAVEDNQRVSFTGAMVVRHGDDFPDQVGVTDPEGAEQLRLQAAHLAVPESQFRVNS